MRFTSHNFTEELANLHSAFGEKIRIDLVLALRDHGALRPTDLAPLVGRTRQDCSHHLGKLKQAGLVDKADLGTSRDSFWKITDAARELDLTFGLKPAKAPASAVTEMELQTRLDELETLANRHTSQRNKYSPSRFVEIHGRYSRARGRLGNALELRQMEEPLWEQIQREVTAAEEDLRRIDALKEEQRCAGKPDWGTVHDPDTHRVRDLR